MRYFVLFMVIYSFGIKHYCEGGALKEKIHELKNKANNLKSNVKSVVEKSDSGQMTFTPNSELDYPQGNTDKLKQIHILWEQYYNCQRIKVETMGLKKRIVPTAVVALLGGYLKLICEICTSPRDIDIEIEWYFSNTLSISEAQVLMIDEFIFTSPHDGSLYIFNILLSQAGLYICKQGNNTASPYIVHVFDNETFVEVHPDTAPNPHALPPSTISNLFITLSTQWTEWSECSECGQVGKRMRVGICYVDVIEDKEVTAGRKSRKPNSYALRDSASLYSKKLTRETSYLANTESNKWEILNIFEDGIPCRSKLLPDFIMNAWEVKSRPSEIMVGFCKVPCPENTMFIISDENGNVIDIANNSAGEYSYHQEKPTVPNVERVAIFAEYKSSIVIRCPGSSKKNIPTEWFTGKTALVNKELKKQTVRRVSINKQNNLIIKDVMFSDARVYSCWQRKALVGTVRLYVDKTRKLEINRPITFIGASLILITFGFVYLKVFINKSKK